MKRSDDFETRRQHLKELSDEDLEKRFWELAGQVVDPMIQLAEKNTTPSIERSILLRMGFSSLEARSIVEGVMDRNLMPKGAGHVIFRLAREKNTGIREAGLKLAQGEWWDEASSLFKEEKA